MTRHYMPSGGKCRPVACQSVPSIPPVARLIFVYMNIKIFIYTHIEASFAAFLHHALQPVRYFPSSMLMRHRQIGQKFHCRMRGHQNLNLRLIFSYRADVHCMFSGKALTCSRPFSGSTLSGIICLTLRSLKFGISFTLLIASGFQRTGPDMSISMACHSLSH
jgi:hypothetical protein